MARSRRRAVRNGARMGRGLPFSLIYCCVLTTHVYGYAAETTEFYVSNSSRDSIGYNSSAGRLKGACGHFIFEGRAECEFRRVL